MDGTDAFSVGGLVIEELVVSGSFSNVYRAHDPQLQRTVAVKVFHLSADKEASLPFPRDVWQRRFITEARILAHMDHPHLIRVDGLGTVDDGAPYAVMPWCVANLRREIGRDVTDPQKIAALPPQQRPRALGRGRAAEILRQVCLGLAALHAKGYVHRDVKPSNLLLTAREGGTVKLCDLGLAKTPAEADRTLSGGPVWLGTPDYAAPEQLQDAGAVNDRADVYSVGVLGWRLLTGRLPQAGETALGDAAPEIPDDMAALIGQAMAPVPQQRPTALQMAARLTAMAPQSAG